MLEPNAVNTLALMIGIPIIIGLLGIILACRAGNKEALREVKT